MHEVRLPLPLTKRFSPSPFHSIPACRSVAYMTEAVQGLFFNTRVVQMADAILGAMAALNYTSFAGVHLRLEADWFNNHVRALQARPVCRQNEMAAM